MGILRAIYNRAVDKGLVMSTNPFKNVFTGMDKTIKRAIDVNSIHRIIMLDFSDIQRYDFARDMFLFSFYTRGMSFVDMAFLKRKILRMEYCHTNDKRADNNFSFIGKIVCNISLTSMTQTTLHIYYR